MHSNPHYAPTTTHDIVTEEEDDFMDDDSNDTPVLGEPPIHHQQKMVAIAHEASRSRTEEGKARKNKAAIIAQANAF